MGFLRFFLASLVVFGHVGGQQFVDTIGALCAVQVFFLISGFYMAATFTKNYAYDGGGYRFFLSRYLRLYPFYAFSLAITAITYFACSSRGVPINATLCFKFFADRPNALQVFAVGGLFIQDVLSISALDHVMLPIRQGWSIGAELVFYAMVPMLSRVRSKSFLAFLAVAFLALKYGILYQYGFRYSYFPFYANFGYFILGYFLYGVRGHLEIDGRFATALLIALCIGSLIVGGSEFEISPIRNLIVICTFAAAIPTIFATVHSRVDSFFGDMSYGIYLFHFFLVDLAISNGLPVVLAPFLGGQRNGVVAVFLLVVVISCASSLGFDLLIQSRLDRWRRKTFYRRVHEQSADALQAGQTVSAPAAIS